MIIKSSYGSCEKCRLLNCKSCILETNTNGNLEDTEVLFIAENPGKDEVNASPPTPLIGKAGKVFRDPFNTYVKDYFKWTISNCVLCATINNDKTTGNPVDDDLENCTPNLMKLIEICQPKLIVAMGATPMKVFGLGKTGITDKAYKFYEWQNNNLFLMCHPSYINYNGGIGSEEGKKFEAGFERIREFLNEEDSPKIKESLDELLSDLCVNEDNKTEDAIELKQDATNISFTIPEKYYTKDYRLVDIQYINKQDRLIFIFRDKNNEKVFYEPSRVTNNYYYYESVTPGKIIEDIRRLKLVQCNFKDRKNNSKCYGSDVPLETKHAADYYLNNKEEADVIDQNIMFIDIEVYTFDDRAFPTPEKALHPISAISFGTNKDNIRTYILDIPGKIDPKVGTLLQDAKSKNLKITLFQKETDMIKAFATALKSAAPDIITAWNVSFDSGYIYNRMKRLNLNPNILSPFDNCWVDMKNNYCMITGFIVIDMMAKYKELTESKEESYSLQAISEKHLGVGKYEYEGELFSLYERNILQLAEYNKTDVTRLVELNNKLRHIELINELRQTATTTWKGVSSTIGQAEGLFLNNLTKRNLCFRNRGEVHSKTEKIPGAYVKVPTGGVHEWIVDWDFASLYPNIIRSWNIGPNTFLGKINEEVMFRLIYERDKVNLDEIIDYQEDPIHNSKTKKIKIKDLLKIAQDNNATMNVAGTLFKGHDIEKSIFFEICNELLENRKVYKKLKFEAKNPTEKKVYDNKQWALKILANSLYGVLLNEYFRFYNLDLGRSVTLSGQEAIRFAGYHLNNYMENEDLKVNLRFEKEVENDLKYLTYIDTDSLFIKIGDYIKDKKKISNIDPSIIFEAVNDLSPILNGKIIKTFIDFHGIPDKYSYLSLKQEIIADVAYFLSTKKKYALHIINQEGYEVDKMDIKGIEIRRSDYPRLTKELLQNILKIIFTQKTKLDIDELLEMVDEAKNRVQDFASKGDKCVGRPVSFGKEHDDYKSIPQGVRAMEMWNELVYDIFRPGSKAILFHINGIDLEKAPDYVKKNYNDKFLKKFKNKDLDVIAVPDDVEFLPDYFIVNVKEITNFALDARMDLILEPLFKKSNAMLTF
jgi:uracil-DNA glycosylase family 4